VSILVSGDADNMYEECLSYLEVVREGGGTKECIMITEDILRLRAEYIDTIFIHSLVKF